MDTATLIGLIVFAPVWLGGGLIVLVMGGILFVGMWIMFFQFLRTLFRGEFFDKLEAPKSCRKPRY